MPPTTRDARRDWERESARRAAAAGGELTIEDRILHALLVGTSEALAEAASLRGRAELLDHDYLAYWVDELAQGRAWRALG